jgi:subtilisin family serine protease
LFLCSFLLFCITLNAKLAPLHTPSTGEAVGTGDSYIVIFKEDTPLEVFEKHIETSKAMVGEEAFGFVYKTVFKGYSAKLNSAQLLTIRQNQFVDFVEVDQVVKASACVSGESGSWGQTRVSQQEVIDLDGNYYASGTGGAEVFSYIMDTGVYLAHSDFEGRARFGFKAEASWNDDDRHGHGTHVASTVGGKIYGIAKQTNIVAVKVLGDNGSGSWAGVIAGCDYVAAQHQQRGKPSTANMSLGGGFSAAVNAAVNSAVQMGVFFAIAAGNNNQNACNFSPASAANAMCVGSTEVDSLGETSIDVRSYFSNWGTCTHIYAPGTLITGAWIGNPNAIHTISGTSMAAPHVCGLGALLLGDNQNMSPSQVKASLQTAATKDVIDMECGSNTGCLSSPNLLGYNGCATSL